jgi:hypothetical protein
MSNEKLNKESKLKIDLEEFKVMHGQITSRNNTLNTIMAMNNTLIVAVLTIIFAYIIPMTFDSDGSTEEDKLILLNFFLLLVTIPFYLFIESYLHSNYMIATTATFIHRILREQLSKEAGSKLVLLNEYWFHYNRGGDKQYQFFFRAPFTMLIVPIIMVIMYISFNFYFFEDRFNEFNLYLEILLLLINLIVIYFAVKRIIKGDKILINITKKDKDVLFDLIHPKDIVEEYHSGKSVEIETKKK